MTSWGWTPERTAGIWRHGASWLRPFAAAAPYLTVLLLLLMLYVVGGTLASARGVLFDLPEAGLGEGEATELVALVIPYALFGIVRWILDRGRRAAVAAGDDADDEWNDMKSS